MIRLAHRDDQDLQINMVPLIDLMLFLIVFFLAATSFADRERDQDVQLPVNSNPKSLSRAADTRAVVNVLRDGAIRYQGRPTTDTELEARLRERRTQVHRPLQVLLRADRRAAYGNVAVALAAVERAGVERPAIVTRSVELAE